MTLFYIDQGHLASLHYSCGNSHSHRLPTLREVTAQLVPGIAQRFGLDAFSLRSCLYFCLRQSSLRQHFLQEVLCFPRLVPAAVA